MALLTTSDAAARLGITVRHVRWLINNKRLKAQRIGRDWAITEQALKEARPKIYGKPGRPKKQPQTKAA